MKRLLLLLLSILLLSLSPAFADGDQPTLAELLEQKAQLEEAIARLQSEDAVIHQAADALASYWEDTVYPRSGQSDGYFEIKWTRVVYIREDFDRHALFNDMRCFVEFFLLTDYYGSAPYYGHAGMYEVVALYADGTFRVMGQHPLDQYRSRTFNSDFSAIIDSISDRGSDFNCVRRLSAE